MSLQASLSDLLEGFAPVPRDCSIAGIQCRSAAIRPGDLFAACRGTRRHGLEGLPEALEKGAAAVIYELDSDQEQPGANVPCVAVPDLSRTLSAIAGRFYRDPSARLPVIGITGTDGKTSTSHLIAQILGALEQSCGVIGTLGAGRLGALHTTGHTTPDAVRLQAELFDMAQRGDTVAVLEVSSHALDQHRCDAVRFETAVFTTLGRDHLDYHQTPERYAAAKRRLFTELKPERAVINIDDPFGHELAEQMESKARVHTCAMDAPAESTARVTGLTAEGLSFEWTAGGETHAVQAPGLYGRFNVMNLLLSATAVQARGVPMAKVAAAMEGLSAVPGRLERVAQAPGPVFIDYAHTPDALEAALCALREHFGADIHCVFGCGGDRDRGKRPRMGEVAQRLAARVTLTDDNPRSEAPGRIVEDILKDIPKSASVAVRHDRAEAIRRAVREAASGEVVLIAGKGHESEQVAAGKTRPFSDHAAVHAALEAGA